MILDFSYHTRPFLYDVIPFGSIDRVILRSSDGIISADPYFAINYRVFRSNQVSVEGYHNWHDNLDPLEQAATWAAVLQGVGYDAVIAWADVERVYDQWMTVTERQRRYLAFEERMAHLLPRVTVGVYTRGEWWDKYMKLAQADRPLWVAHYNTAIQRPRLPLGWRRYARWQFSDKGRVQGFTGSVDLNKEVDTYVPPARVGVVTASGLRVRAGPGTDHAIVGTLAFGTRLAVYEIAAGPGSVNGWANLTPDRVNSNWAALDYMELEA